LLQEQRTAGVRKNVPVEVILGVVGKNPVVEDVERRLGHGGEGGEVLSVDDVTLLPEFYLPLL